MSDSRLGGPRHWLDVVLLVCVGGFALGWLTYDVPAFFGVDLPAGTWYETAVDPFSAQLPFHIELALMAAVFVYGPFYVVAFWGLWRRAPWVGLLALPVSGALLATTTIFAAASLTSETPPVNTALFVAINGPYIVVPLLMIYRFTLGERAAPSR